MPYLPDSGFSRVAPFYDRLAHLVYGDALEKAQLALLPYLPPQGRVLVIGGGSGWILEQLLQTGRQLDILYLEAAPAMLHRAAKRYQHYNPPHTCTVSFRLGTERSLQVQEQFEAVLTPFLLDLFPPPRLRELMARLASSLVPDGRWLFADFWPLQQPPPLWQRLLLQSMYSFFRLASGIKAHQLPDYGTHFRELGFQEAHTNSFFREMVQAKVFQRISKA